MQDPTRSQELRKVCSRFNASGIGAVRGSVGMIVGLVTTMVASYVLYSLVALPCLLKEEKLKQVSFLKGLLTFGVPITAGVLSLSPMLHAISITITSLKQLAYPQDIRFPYLRLGWTFLFSVYVSLSTLAALFYPLVGLTENVSTDLDDMIEDVAGKIPLRNKAEIKASSKVLLQCAIGQIGLLVANMYLIVRLLLGFGVGFGILARFIKLGLFVSMPVMGQMTGMSLASRAMDKIGKKDITCDDLSRDMKNLSLKLDNYRRQ